VTNCFIRQIIVQQTQGSMSHERVNIRKLSIQKKKTHSNFLGFEIVGTNSENEDFSNIFVVSQNVGLFKYQ
jgi:hypothetical protein